MKNNNGKDKIKFHIVFIIMSNIIWRRNRKFYITPGFFSYNCTFQIKSIFPQIQGFLWKITPKSRFFDKNIYSVGLVCDDEGVVA